MGVPDVINEEAFEMCCCTINSFLLLLLSPTPSYLISIANTHHVSQQLKAEVEAGNARPRDKC